MVAMFMMLWVWPAIVGQIIITCAYPQAWTVDWQAYADGLGKVRHVE